jgi:hypothetical protein
MESRRSEVKEGSFQDGGYESVHPGTNMTYLGIPNQMECPFEENE